MVFTTNLFLFSFLPLVLVCYYALPLLQNGMAKLAAKWSSDANTLHGHSSRVTSVAARPDTVPRARNGFLLLASYIFYGWWNPWFLPLIAAVTLGNYHCGRYVSGSGRSQRQRWWGTALAVTVSLGALGFFKYFNFVAANVNHVLAWLGADAEGKSRQLVYGEDGRHVYGGHVSPDGKYVLFTGNVEEDGDPGNAGAPMGLMRLADAPMIGGQSKELRKLHSHVNDGPVLVLPQGWEPCWTYREIGGGE